MEEELRPDPRFVVSRSPERIGFYRNFERAMSLAPAAADLVALADQDDRWEHDKLEILLREIGDAQLVYSDARIVNEDGEVLADTYWQERRNNHDDIASVLMANSVTGAASLFRRELLDLRASVPARAVPPLPRPLARPHRSRARRRGVCPAPALRLRPAR